MEWQDDIEDDDLRVATKEYLPQTVLWTTDWTTGALIDQMRRGVFDVDPPFQRRSVWSDQKSSLYIESLLLGCPVPAVTLAEAPSTNPAGRQYIVIDGKQRLLSLKKFAIDQTLLLTGLQTLTELNGLGYMETAKKAEFARFENLPIRTVVMRNWQKSEVLQFVFHRLNSQVTPLSTHELRRSLLAGKFTDFLDERSATSKPIQRILNIREPDFRLRDAELLLRAIAFSSFLGKYRGNLKLFLDTTTRTLNRSWGRQVQVQLSNLADQIDAALEATYVIFGEAAFQRFEDGTAVGRFNRAVFDVMVMTLRNEVVRYAAESHADSVQQAFQELLNDSDFNQWTQATTKSRDAVHGRINRWSSALSTTLGMPELPELTIASSLSVN